jgi:hypothetical protein
MSYDRLTAENAAVLFVDHQTGLANGVQTQSCHSACNIGSDAVLVQLGLFCAD